MERVASNDLVYSSLEDSCVSVNTLPANSWSGWGISKSQPLASKASRLPLTLHPDIWYPEMVTLHRQTIISRPFFY